MYPFLRILLGRQVGPPPPHKGITQSENVGKVLENVRNQKMLDALVGGGYVVLISIHPGL